MSKYADKFWSKVEPIPESGCFIWMGAVSSTGYGSINFDGKRLRAHRVAWFLDKGTMPDKSVLHKCDTPLCCNPRHLFLGTQRDNMEDMKRKGRSIANKLTGELNGRAKLQARDIVEIRSSREDAKLISKKYGISAKHARDIKNIKTWIHISVKS